MRTLVLILLGGLLVALPTVSADPAVAAATPCADLEALAHRGFHSPAGVAENSAEAFQGAIDRGYSIETDVWADADGTLWIFHDRDVSHTTDGTGFIDEMHTADVANLHYRKGGASLLTFDDAMQIFASAPTTRVYIEPKQGSTAAIVAQAVSNSSRANTTWITGFTTYAHTAEPSVQLAEKEYDGDLESPESLIARGVNIVALVPSDLTTENVDYYHAGGVEVQDRDANQPSEWQNTISSGADGQLTDFPDDLQAYCASGQILPVVSGIDPSEGQPGTPVTVTGTDFQNVTGVSFGGVAASYTVDSSTQITATAPAGMPAQATVVVTTVAGPSDNVRAFDVPPVISSLTPASGGEGTSVTISGTTLGQATAVTFDGRQAAFVIDSSTQLTAVVPRGTYGTVPVVVITPAGRSAAPVYFQSADPPLRAITEPATAIRSKTPSVLLSHSAKVFFTAAGATSFVCRLDGKVKECAAPSVRLRHLSPGDHSFSVRGQNAAGKDPTKSRWHFTVPIDDRQLHGDGAWSTFRAPGAFGKSVSVTSTRGATLTHEVTRARSVWLMVTTAPNDGDLRVYLGDSLLKVVHTDGQPRVRLVRVAHSRKKFSGTLRLVAGSDARVSVDGFAVSRHR